MRKCTGKTSFFINEGLVVQKKCKTIKKSVNTIKKWLVKIASLIISTNFLYKYFQWIGVSPQSAPYRIFEFVIVELFSVCQFLFPLLTSTGKNKLFTLLLQKRKNRKGENWKYSTDHKTNHSCLILMLQHIFLIIKNQI